MELSKKKKILSYGDFKYEYSIKCILYVHSFLEENFFKKVQFLYIFLINIIPSKPQIFILVNIFWKNLFLSSLLFPLCLFYTIYIEFPVNTNKFMCY